MENVMTQMNVRLEADLKRKGDESLNHAHISPSRAIRALWSFLKRHHEEPEAVARMVAELEAADDRPQSEEERKANILAESHSLVEAATSFMSANAGVETPELSDRELLEEALLSRYEERGLLQ